MWNFARNFLHDTDMLGLVVWVVFVAVCVAATIVTLRIP